MDLQENRMGFSKRKNFLTTSALEHKVSWLGINEPCGAGDTAEVTWSLTNQRIQAQPEEC